jgi:hypothetical protein
MKKALLELQKYPNFHGDRLLQNGHFSFLAQLTNPSGGWTIKSATNSNVNLTWILKGFKPFGKKSINSLKFFLDMIFNTVNLDWLTCIKIFEVPIGVVIRAWLK